MTAVREAWVTHEEGKQPHIHTAEEIGRYVIEDRPLDWQLMGLQQTASGYGRKLTSSRMLRFDNDPRGRWRRVYITIFSNSGTAWIVYQGQKYVVRD